MLQTLLPLILTAVLVSAGGGVAAPTGFTFMASANTVVAGGYLTFSWTNANTASQNDWVLYTSNNNAPSSSNYLSDCWQYTYGLQTKTGQAPPSSGSISVKAPATPGTYKAYYCQNNGYSCPGSLTITVTKPNVQCLAGGKTNSNIKHVITIISENHSFDSYYGKYCQAPVRSGPSCNNGPACCDQGDQSLNGVTPQLLDDTSNKANDRDHTAANEICEINGGKMDKFLSGCSGSSANNYAMASGAAGSAEKYWGWAQSGAMADRFFQSAAGQSSMNDMYFARGSFVFNDNDAVPQSDGCYNPFSSSKKSYQDPTIADLLVQCGVSWTFYAQDFKFDNGLLNCYPDNYDPSDNPFEYYPSVRNSVNNAQYFKDFNGNFDADVDSGNLPAVTYIKALGTASEHPLVSTISAGEDFNQHVIDMIMNSPIYRDNTLIILTPDESGGFRDSVPPPANSNIDNRPYGPRVPFVVLGNFAKTNYISHVPMEHSSLLRFIESNFLGGAPGQLQTRDAIVNNIGDLLDQSKTGYFFP
ncbi:phosphoesterase-domain-containing protein, partial [Rhizoclosmatium globosum]